MLVDRCFAFADISGFTRFTREHGEEAAVEALAAFRARVREVSSRRGVRVAKWLGDGVMFSSPDALGPIASALEVVGRPTPGMNGLRVRAGVTAGPAIMFEGDDYIGSPVNLAARLCDVAAPGEVLAPADIGDRLPRWAEVVGVAGWSLQGIGFDVLAGTVRLRQGAATVVDPVCRLPLDPALLDLSVELDDGERQWFCSDACAYAWRVRHPAHAPAVP